MLNPSSWVEPVNNQNAWKWRQFLKLELCRKRGWQSDWSGKYLTTCEMHEGILTRANVPAGLPYAWMIYHEVNCFLLLTEEHIPHPPSREWCIQKAFNRYGEELVRAWFYTIPFKVRPFDV